MDTSPADEPAASANQALEVLASLVHVIRQAAAGPGADGLSLTVTQFRLLRRLAEGVRLTSDLALDLDVTPATVSAAIDCLVRRGLVERGERAGDRRAVPLCATPAGQGAVEAARQRQHAALFGLIAQLSPAERQGLTLGIDGLARVLHAR